METSSHDRRSSPLKILLMDDDPVYAQLLGDYLAGPPKRAPYELHCSASLASGLNRLAFGDIDVLLLELNLPDSSGMNVLSSIKTRFPHLPVVVLVEPKKDTMGHQFVRMGAQDYLVKTQVYGSLLWHVLNCAMERQRNERALRTKEVWYQDLEEQMLHIQRMENLGLMAAGMVHDLGNTLSPVVMLLPMLRAEIHDKGTLALANSVEACVMHSVELLKQILALATGKETATAQAQPPHLLSDFASIVQQSLPHSITVQTTIAPDLWSFEGNPTQLFQMLINLCINAKDAMPRGGTLSLAAENLKIDKAAAALIPNARAGTFVVWKVTDTGAGIPDNIRHQIFTPFFTTKRAGKGMGLGLSSVLTIVRAHHGFIEIRSKENQGTQFMIYFPALP